MIFDKPLKSGVLLLLIIMTVPALRAEQGATLSLKEVLAGGDQTPAVQDALAVYERTLQETRLAALTGDWGVSLTPTVRTQMAEWGTPDTTSLSAVLGFSVFLGRNSLQEEKYQAALRKSETAALILDQARRLEIQTLFVQYADLWLLQEEAGLLQTGVELSRQKYEDLLELYEGGAADLGDVEDAEEELSQAEEALITNRYEQQLAWLTLRTSRGLEGRAVGTELPVLEEPLMEWPDPAPPRERDGQVLASSGELRSLQDQLTGYRQTISRLEKRDWDVSLRPSLSYDDQTISGSFAFQNRALGLNWTLPSGSWPDSGGGGGNGWSAAISLGLSYGPGKLDEESIRLSVIDLERQALKVEDLENQLALKYRTGYQAYLGALESVDRAQRSLERSGRLKESVELRQEAGQALLLDVRSAALAHEWGKWRLASALVQLQKAHMSLAVMAGDLGFLLD